MFGSNPTVTSTPLLLATLLLYTRLWGRCIAPLCVSGNTANTTRSQVHCLPARNALAAAKQLPKPHLPNTGCNKGHRLKTTHDSHSEAAALQQVEAGATIIHVWYPGTPVLLALIDSMAE
jgi:hypothetical protein